MYKAQFGNTIVDANAPSYEVLTREIPGGVRLFIKATSESRFCKPIRLFTIGASTQEYTPSTALVTKLIRGMEVAILNIFSDGSFTLLF